MSKVRIVVEPVVGRPAEGKTQNFYWKLEEVQENKFWGLVDNWEEYTVFGDYRCFLGYCETMEEAKELAHEAFKEYCRQRKSKRDNNEYIRLNTYIEEMECPDLK